MHGEARRRRVGERRSARDAHVATRDAAPSEQLTTVDVDEPAAPLARVVAVVNREAGILLLAASLAGARGEHLPDEWAGYIHRFVHGAQARIERDQLRGIAPADISPRISAQALLAMVESHVVRELVLRDGDASESIRVLAELWWRAVYSKPETDPPTD